VTTQVAVDMDSTLAAVAPVAFERLGYGFTYDDIDNWNVTNLPVAVSRYIDEIHNAWVYNTHAIEQMDESTVHSMHALYMHDGIDVDIVTSHGGSNDESDSCDSDEIVTRQAADNAVSDGKREWCESHNIPYDNFVTVGLDEQKGQFTEYDVYIDDKPDMPDTISELNPEAEVWLYDQPYNRQLDTDAPYTRVERLQDAAIGIIDSEKMGLYE